MVTSMEQLSPCQRYLPVQLWLDTENAAASVPPMVRLEMRVGTSKISHGGFCVGSQTCSQPSETAVTVMVRGALVVPGCWLPKSMLLGVREATGSVSAAAGPAPRPRYTAPKSSITPSAASWVIDRFFMVSFLLVFGHRQTNCLACAVRFTSSGEVFPLLALH